MKPTTKLVPMPLTEAVRLKEEAARLGRPGCSDEQAKAGVRPPELDFEPSLLTERQRPVPTGADATYVDLECLADIAVEPLEAVWGSVVTRGCVTVLAGEPGIGKSFVALDIAAAATRGDPPRPVCSHHEVDSENDSRPRVEQAIAPAAEQRRVVICSPYCERASTLIPRLVAAKADLSLIQAISGVREAEDIDKDGSRWSFQLERDLPILESELMFLQGGESKIGLIVIDPFPDDDFSGTRQAKKLHEITSRLAEIAACYQVAVLLVCDALPIDDPKRAKSVTIHPDVERIAQSVWVVERDPDSAKGRLLLPAKSNLDEDSLALAFSIQQKKVTWESKSVSMTAQEFRLAMMQRRRNPLLFEDASELARASDWLKDRLADGPVQSWLVKQEAAENEISYATLRRAFNGLRCVSNQVKGTRHHEWATTGGSHARRRMGAECGDLSRVEGTGEASDSRDAGVPAEVPAFVGDALDGTWNVPATLGVHDEHVLEHQFAHVLQPVKQGVSSDSPIGVHRGAGITKAKSF